MRLRLDPVTAHHVGDVARRENRSPADALARLVFEAIKARRGLPNEPVSDIEPAGNDGYKTLAIHVRGGVNAAVRHFADQENRSLSNALNCLVRAGLRAYGVSIDAQRGTASATTEATR